MGLILDSSVIIAAERGAQSVSQLLHSIRARIGVTALHFGYAIATLNERHFRLIPGLAVVQL